MQIKKTLVFIYIYLHKSTFIKPTVMGQNHGLLSIILIFINLLSTLSVFVLSYSQPK